MLRSVLMGALIALGLAGGIAAAPSPARAEDNGPTLGFGLAANNEPYFAGGRMYVPRYRPQPVQYRHVPPPAPPGYYQPGPPRYYRPPPPRYYRPPPPPLFIAPPRYVRPLPLPVCHYEQVRVTKYDRYGRPYKVIRRVRVCD